MRIESVGCGGTAYTYASRFQTIEGINHTLDVIAKVHKVDRDQMIQDAVAAGDGAEDWQKRVINLVNRLERLT